MEYQSIDQIKYYLMNNRVSYDNTEVSYEYYNYDVEYYLQILFYNSYFMIIRLKSNED